MNKPVNYIARKEDFQHAITDNGRLDVMAVFGQNDIERTCLTSFIKNVRLGDKPSLYFVSINGVKDEVKLYLI